MSPIAPSRLSVTVASERWPLITPFRITGYTFYDIELVVVTLDDGRHQGRGEATGVYYLDDRPPAMLAQIEAVRSQIEAGADRQQLAQILPPCAARSALDCALWDLEAKRAGRPVWRLAGLAPPKPLLTTYTIGADAPEAMAERAGGFADARALKLKLVGDGLDAARVQAVRESRPEVWLAVDANQGFTPESLADLTPTLVEARVELIEQPFHRGQDAFLDGLKSPIPIAADESVQGLADVAAMVGRAQVINIKLDKCGGLTEGLAMAAEARRLGLGVMVGNMLGTGLGMAPAYLVGQLCDVVDLDGPLLLAADRTPGAVYRDGLVDCPEALWGGAA
ncbi:dipeptide epimerase [Phenylobacterium sp.]|uniref:dipeptide epimerase n=1 Tax=Phenylobacterium sp. TaxID=1871053 RepID=UPI002731508D|nr:dipeptide epimerase [Phenylobacterium sp.]MDP1618058.1 dipeptide epimerase [Phenylobacterium sp.]MDP1987285.1 dipeptide epimerase [Phenylobacterium sp.]